MCYVIITGLQTRKPLHSFVSILTFEFVQCLAAHGVTWQTFANRGCNTVRVNNSCVYQHVFVRHSQSKTSNFLSWVEAHGSYV